MTKHLSKALFRIREIARRIWVRTSLIALVAFVAAGSSFFVAPLLPATWTDRVAPEAVARILEILASTMLAVTTFSLTVMLAARQFASSQSTPRAHRVVAEEGVTQNVLATFLGAYVFSLTALVLLESGMFEGSAATVLLIFTVLVITLVVLAILRWIEHLTSIGGVDETAAIIEDRTRGPVEAIRQRPAMGAKPRLPDRTPPSGADRVAADRTGYVVHVDIAALQDCAEDAGGEVYLDVRPGSFVMAGESVGWVTRGAMAKDVAQALTIQHERSFDQDPRYGLSLLREIAQRALSPGVNDPGTAMSVIGRLGRLLHDPEGEAGRAAGRDFPRVHLPAITAEDLVRPAFGPIARDAGGDVEVHRVLQRTLAVLAGSPDPVMQEAARAASDHALAHAKRSIALDADYDSVEQAAPPRPAEPFSVTG